MPSGRFLRLDRLLVGLFYLNLATLALGLLVLIAGCSTFRWDKNVDNFLNGQRCYVPTGAPRDACQ